MAVAAPAPVSTDPPERFPRRVYAVVAASGGGAITFSSQAGAAAAARSRATDITLAMEGAANLQAQTLLREGPLQKHNRDGPHNYQFILTSESLLYAEPALLALGKMSLNREIPLVSCMVVEHEPGNPGDPSNTFRFLSRQKSFMISADSAQEMACWFAEIHAAAEAARRVARTTLTEDDCAPLWTPNDEACDCMVCNRPFGLLNRRHHCRNCGKVVCGACSLEKARVERLHSKGLVKVCNPCARELKSTRRYGAVALEPGNQAPALSVSPPSGGRVGGGGGVPAAAAGTAARR